MRRPPASIQLRRLALMDLLTQEPGLKRAELAKRVGWSERQIQSDLGALGQLTYRAVVDLEIVRDHGYRFRVAAVHKIREVAS